MARPDAVQQLIDHLVAGSSSAGFFARGPEAPAYLRSAPGRLDVLGGLGADAGGTLAQMGLRARAAVAVQLQQRAGDGPEAIFRSDQMTPPLGEPEVRIERASSEGSWATGLLAAWRRLRPADDSRTLVAAIRSDIPLGAGQASSTAMLAAFVAAACDARNLALDANGQAALVCAGEAATLRSHPGAALHAGEHTLIDALTCLLTGDVQGTGGISRYNAQPHERMGEVPLPSDVQVLALDTGVRYTSAAATLDELRIAGAMGFRIIETIYRDLGQPHTPLHGYLANTSPLLYRQYFRTLLPRRMRAADFIRTYGPLPESAGPLDGAAFYRVRTAVDHIIAEHEHAEQFLQAMEELDGGAADEPERQRTLQRAGRLLLASHHSYRLRLDLSCREADWLVDKLMEAGPDKGIYGARITACGGGGTVMALLQRSSVAADAILDAIRGYQQIAGLTLGVTEAGGAASAGALRIPARPLILPLR
jgi:L-arabinokinase